ncbi:Tet(A)/Tet(B)/Tet(C) family tetracycline efflux MFS transporter [Neorhizobium sp. P12A]|uniref:Tet(A)/Tet(B)/Tet(C) family tetracycline efflux MFS transporter n=1 Tax=Neorhizobium sp. P12A TaxID=2268027 RepID=UPI0011EF412A|nr:Tet(A)/Tet(B)/Tet(C) family tetracycline efflux MFS transporter [Neorhizobium sp. P12A]KAA0698664.1 Tet(A)/Tet(B)/Tet(C) family tetracycline efflux MFS transporter [Neorhizobium sp. P12A]
MQNMLPVILATIVLDAAGIGLTLPILPRLLQEVGHTSELGWLFGAFLSLYALMQFLFSPVLGGLSDRFGRKPVLLVSLGGAAVDYLFMAFTPSLWLLFIGRAIAGITGANMAVASAVITDLTPEDQRARRFGQLSACFGIGFIAGPAIGGLLGEVSIRAPFVAAAFLNAVNLALAFFTLRETRRRDTEASESKNSFSPLGTLRWVSGLGGLLPLIGAYIVLAFVGEVGGTIWVLYGQDKFAWSPITIGISLAGFGLFHAGIQAFVAGPISERWGERRALLISITTDSIAYILIAIATEGWMVFALLPLFCLGGIGAPALQSLLTSGVRSDQQGRLQGVLSSMTSLASIVGPLLISTAYFMSRSSFPGLVWIAGAALYWLCLPVFLSRSKAEEVSRSQP